MSTIYETKYYLLFDIIHLFTASSTVKTPKHTYAEDYCVGSEITKLPRKIMQTKLSNNLKIIRTLDEDKNGVHEYAKYYTDTLRMYNNTIVMMEKKSKDSMSAILRKESIFFTK